MSDVSRTDTSAPKELRIVGFLCNWCSYGGADTAGVARFKQPTDLRIIKVPCSGRVDPLFVVRALLSGADGVLVSGCHPRDCHYSEGNFYARRRLEMLKRFLPFIGIDEKRFHYTWISASEGQRWQQTVSEFTRQIHELGPLAINGASVAPSIQARSREQSHDSSGFFAVGASPTMADSQDAGVSAESARTASSEAAVEG